MRRDLNAKKNCLTFSQTPIKKSRFYNLSFWFCKGNHNVSSENTTWGFMRFQFSCKCSWRNGKCSYRTRTRTTRRTSRLLPHLIINLSHNRRRSHFLDSSRNFSRRVPSSETRACSEIMATNWTQCVRHWCSTQTQLTWCRPCCHHRVVVVLMFCVCEAWRRYRLSPRWERPDPQISNKSNFS